MVQGVFWDNRRSNLYIIDWDFKSVKYRYLANSYFKVLDVEVKPIFKRLDNKYLFIQDNASIYTIYKVQEWFRLQGIIIITIGLSTPLT